MTRTFDASPDARHRRLQRALRLVKDAPANGRSLYRPEHLENPETRQRALAYLAHDVVQQERREKS